MKPKTLFSPHLTFEEAEELIKNGADVNEQNAYQHTPLYFIQSVKIANLLLENGANVNHLDNHGRTPLFKVMNKEIAQLFIQYGADVNHIDQYKLNALYYINQSDIIEVLIQNKADFNVYHEGDLPIDYQVDLKCARVFIKYGSLPGKIITYQMFHDLFTKEQQKAFNMFLTITNDDNDFYHMCLAYMNKQKNNDKIEIKEMEIL